ncbi:MAG TPA: cytochrome c1 [Bauldia sp.]|nr:cytochrome c1 [Bauldia sp.]
MIAGVAALCFGLSASFAAAQEEGGHASDGEAVMHFPIKKPALLDWSFAGIFGKYDPAQLQRGFQVYREVCSQCHGIKYVAFRNMAEPDGPGYSPEQVAALAAQYEVTDGPNESGEMFTRPARPSDRFPSPFPNDQAAAAVYGVAPPDLSLIAKARAAPRGPVWTVLDFFTQYQEAGPNYIHALLTGYGEEPPPGVTVPAGAHYNPYFLSAAVIAMPPPLADGDVKYSDGSPQTVDQYAKDVAAFLMWTAEPHLVARKRLGFQVGIFLLVFASLMYLTKRRVWAAVAH